MAVRAGYALGCWLREHKEQVWLFTRDFAVPWTNNVSERGAKAAKRHQAVSGYWHTLRTLARWCRIRSYLESASAHGITAIDAIRAAIEESPGYRHCPQPPKARQRTPVNGHPRRCSQLAGSDNSKCWTRTTRTTSSR